MDSGGIQFKSGGFDSVSFITTRKDVIEIAVKQSLIQRKLGLATIQTINQATPVHEEEIKDVPIVVANQFMAWYGERFNDVEVERSEEHTSELQSRGHLVCRLLL